MSEKSTSNDRALIIGASRGLGLGLTEAYLVRGWNVVATLRSQSNPAGLAALQERFPDRLRVEQLDINERGQFDFTADQGDLISLASQQAAAWS